MKRLIQITLFFLTILSGNVFAQQATTYSLYSNNSNIIEISCVETPNHVFVAAVYDNPVLAGGDIVVMLRSLDYGMTWDSITTFASDSLYGTYFDPYLVCDSTGNIYFVAMRGSVVNFSTYDGHDTWVFKSSDDGLSWNLQGYSPNIGSSTGTDFPRTIASSNGNLLLCYQLLNAPDTYINVAHSLDGGVTWSSLDTIPGIPFDPKGCASLGKGFANKINLSFYNFTDGEILYSESINAGQSFSAPVVVSNKANSGFYYLTSMLSNSSVNHKGILFHPTHRFEKTFYSHSSDGQVWNTTLIDSMSAYGQGFLDTDGTVHVAYSKIEGTMHYLYYRFSVDSGNTFSNPLLVDSNPIVLPLTIPMGDYCSIFMGSDGNIHISWCANDGVNCMAKHSIITSTTSIKENPIAENEYQLNYSAGTHQLFISSKHSGNFKIEMMDASDKMIYKNNSGTSGIAISTQNFKSGVYIVRITDWNGQYLKKQVLIR